MRDSELTPPASSVRDLALDLRGLQCPLPVLKTRKAMTHLPAGALIEVLVSDPAARIDMAHYCATAGDTLVEIRDEGAHLRFLIRKG